MSNFSIRYSAWGNPKHKPVLFFHGFPGSHVQARGLVPLIDTHKIYLIAADRPGYGQTFGNGTVFDYLDDLFNVLKGLNVLRFHTIGVSGGAPWAHVMASRFSEHVDSLSIVCGLAPFNSETKNYFTKLQKRALLFGRWVPRSAASWVVKSMMKSFDQDRRLNTYFKSLDTRDQIIFNDPANLAILIASMTEARKQGPKGILNDASLYHRDWLREYCDPSKLATIPTYYFHGLKDRLLNPKMTEWMHSQNRHAKLTMMDNEGHYSLPFRRASEILRTITLNS